MLANDVGWGDLSFHCEGLPTPNITHGRSTPGKPQKNDSEIVIRKRREVSAEEGKNNK